MSCSPVLKSEKNYKKEYLARGTFGVVFKIQYPCKETGKEKKVAMKTLELRENGDVSQKEGLLKEAQNEYEILKRGIPNVLKAYGSFYDEEKLEFKFSTELMHMDLESFILEQGPLDLKTFIPIYTDILRGKILLFSLKFYIFF